MADYAIVVGISHYPKFATADATADLQGPDTDAKDIHDWLIDADGGGLSSENVRLIRSADFHPPKPDEPEPEEATIRRALTWLEEETADRPGDRLYLYFSGHGFAPVLEEGALFTAEATNTIPSYVYAYDWMRNFRKARRFRDVVLWMDCCMTHHQTIPVSSVPIRAGVGTGVPGPAFVAVAAQTKSALEHQMADGQVHGVFSWTLLHGLRGGATDEHGRVTSESLKAFLHDTMPQFLPEDVRNASAVDLHPFIRADAGITFRRFRNRPAYLVTLAFPRDLTGLELKVWTGRPHAAVVMEKITGSSWTGDFVRGLYVAEVPDAGFRHGFQVTGSGPMEVEMRDTGPRVLSPHPTRLFTLDVQTANPAASVSIMDHTLKRIFSDTGALHEFDAPGVYKIRTELGRDISTVLERIILLDQDMQPAMSASPEVPSPAPIPGTALIHESHVARFREGAQADSRAGAALDAPTISVLVRYWLDPEDRPQLPLAHPMEGLELISPDGTVIASLLEDSSLDGSSPTDPVAVWARRVPPGAYYLRQTFRSGRAGEASVIACGDWLTQIALQRSPAELVPGLAANDVVPLVDAAVFMRPYGVAGSVEQDRVVESARLGLAQGRDLLGKSHGMNLQRLLLEEYNDPIAGILGCYLLLIAMEHSQRGVEARQAAFDAAVVRLGKMVGYVHPDVAALSLRCRDPALRTAGPFTVPPIFRAGWQLMTQASYANPELLPASLWERVHAVTNFGPFLAWASDPGSKRVHARQLEHWIQRSGATDSQDAARRLLIPARAIGVTGQGSDV
ncbi:caspase family protein [Crystallibacter degradans]|uniref:caspase family protein n=1 Tax=Crystallibacter degradans TaxID=2726743 RepID=UPI00147535F7|nr:caspase family protein [Arthrobacter sp. SF27]NMR30484.1 hypothetical protein [Arthrobacter sp. SF27]